MIVMEVLEGDSLATAMDSRRRPSPLRAVRLLLPIAHGLAAAHAKGVVHRDVKPENILLCRTDSGGVQPKIIDFGIAKRITDQSGRLTLDGALLGSPDYMAPEQAKGQEATEKSDLWALATVLYELIAGSIPFAREDLHQQLRAIILEDPEPLEGFEGAESLWPIIACALNKDPEERWESMRRFGKELALWALDQRATDDISGVSLESAWLRDATDTDHVFTSIPPPPDSSSGEVEQMPRRASDFGAVAATGGSAFSGPDYAFEDPFIRERRRRYTMLALFAAVIAAGATVGVLIGAGIL
jgi:serine/threonine-protein kinase